LENPWGENGLALFAWIFLIVGGLLISIGISDRWLLIYWYQDMTEHSWFFWGMNLPYIEHPDGVEEFVKYRSKTFFMLGFIHLVVGAVLVPLPDFWILLPFWVLSIFILSLVLRYHLVDVALGINRKYSSSPCAKKVCPKCGKELLLNYKICPQCGESLPDQDV